MFNQEKFETLKSSGHLPSPQGAALKILELCQRSNVSLTEISHAVQADPALTGRVLKIANSPLYARSRPVVSLNPDVLMSVGIQSLRQIVLAFALISANRNGRCKNFDYEDFWSRSLATGVAAQLIGAAIKVAPPVETFTCGLLSQIGRLALASAYPEKFSELLVSHKGNAQDIPAAVEEAAFGVSHLELASAMMDDWGIPKLFSDAVLYHEAPEQSDINPESRVARLAMCLHLARSLANSCFMSDIQRAANLPKLFPIARKAGIDAESLVRLGDQMLSEWNEWSALLEMPVHTATDFSSLEKQLAFDESSAKSMAEESPVRVLIADDDPTTRMLLQHLLNSQGYITRTVANGREALQTVEDFRPHILVTDWLMPEMNGLELICALRKTETGRAIYAVVLTSLREDENLVDAFEAGADDYLVKPIEPSIVKAHLKAGLRVIQVQQQIEKDREELRRLTADLASAHRDAQESALADPLTGLYNRRYAMNRLAQEWASTERSQMPFSIVMLEIDQINQIRDTFGHMAAEEVIKRIGDVLQTHSRLPDVACRIGWETFLILSPNTSLDGALNFAERIRSSIAAEPVMLDEGKLNITISIGLAQKTPSIESHGHLLKLADDAMVNSRNHGCNRMTAAPLN